MSSSMTFTAVKTFGKHIKNFKEVLSLTKKKENNINTLDKFPQLLLRFLLPRGHEIQAMQLCVFTQEWQSGK